MSYALQDSFIRTILAEAGRQRTKGKEIAARAGLCQSSWSDIKNLKQALTLDRAASIASALGFELRFKLKPTRNNAPTRPTQRLVDGRQPPRHTPRPDPQAASPR